MRRFYHTGGTFNKGTDITLEIGGSRLFANTFNKGTGGVVIFDGATVDAEQERPG